MKMVPMEDAQPMSESTAITLLKLTVAEATDKEAVGKVLEDLEQKNYFPYMVYKKRMEVMKLPLNMTPAAVMFMLLVSDRPGHVTCCMVDCMEYQDENGKSEITLEDIAGHMYPFGFYKEEAFIRRAEQIQERKNKWDFIY